MIYITYMSNDRDYKGLLLLNYMLKKYKSNYNLACIVLENVSENIRTKIKLADILLYEFNLSEILQTFGIIGDYNNYLVNKHYYGKYLIFKLTEHKKIVYLDTDLLIKRNVDELFSYDTSDKIYMTYDLLKDQSDNLKFYKNNFNSGVIVTEPSLNTYIKCFTTLKEFENNIGKLETDQTIFNILNQRKQININYLDFKYNYIALLSNILLEKNIIKEKPVIIHFILRPKPWNLIDLDNYVLETKIYSNPIIYFEEWLEMYLEMVKYYLNNFHKNIFVNFNDILLVDNNSIKKLENL
jgi:lipopolysaccharide biosynthesis glycosyltransferase